MLYYCRDFTTLVSGLWGGIPQGSALGPLLFLIYMNDMPSQFKHGKLLQYADDTALICSGASTEIVHQCLTEDLKSLS